MEYWMEDIFECNFGWKFVTILHPFPLNEILKIKHYYYTLFEFQSTVISQVEPLM